MYCKYCGKEIVNDSIFCNYCGGKQSSTNQDIHNVDDTTTKIEVSPIKVEVYKKKEPKKPITINKTVVADILIAFFKELKMTVLIAFIGFFAAFLPMAIFRGDHPEDVFVLSIAIMLLFITVRYIVILVKWVNKNQSKQQS